VSDGLTGTQIRDAIAAHVTAGTLRLAPGDLGALGSAAVDDVIRRFHGGALVASLGKPAAGATSVVYAHASVAPAAFPLYRGQATLDAVITFFAASTGIGLAVDAAMPPEWKLGDAFPALAPTDAGRLILADARIATDVTLPPGSVRIRATVPKPPEPLASAAGGALVLSGTCAVTSTNGDDPLPKLDLVTPAAALPLVGGVTLSAALAVRSTVLAASGDDVARLLVCVELDADLHTPQLDVPITIGLTADSPVLPVFLDRRRAVPPIHSLGQLSGMTAGADPGTALVAAGTPIGTLSLDWVSFSLDTSTWQLSDLQVAVGLGTKWPIIDGIIELEGLFARVRLANLLDPKSLSVAAGARLGVASGTIVAMVELPAKVVRATLEPGTAIEIGHFMERFAPGAVLPGTGTIRIDAFDLEADVGSKAYSLACEADGRLTIVQGFEIDQLSFAARYASGELEELRFGSVFTIAGAKLYLSAGRIGKSWELAGGTFDEHGIDLSELATGIAGAFDVHLPASLPHAGLKDLELRYRTGDGSMGLKGEIDVLGHEDALLKKVVGKVHVDKDANGWTGGIHGEAKLGDSVFTVGYDFQATARKLTADWTATGEETFGIATLAGLVGAHPAIPKGLDLGLTQVGFAYEIDARALTVKARSKTYGRAAFALRSGTFAFGVDVPLRVTLADLPVVGSSIPDGDKLGIAGLGAWILSGPLSKAQADPLRADLAAQKDYPSLPDGDVTTPVMLFGKLRAGDREIALVLPVGGGVAQAPAPSPQLAPPGANLPSPPTPALPSPPTPGPPLPATPPADGTRWFAVGRTFGPFHFERVGIHYVSDGSNTLYVAIDASIALGPLTLSLLGLAIGSPLTSFSPKFTLRGLGLSYVQGSLTIAGALYSVPTEQLAKGTAWKYNGVAVVKAASFGLAAIGSYAQLESGQPSLFLFAQLDAPLGGPPPLFVTGLMGGFGYNRSLAIPAQDEVLDFPLLSLGAPPAPGKKAPAQDPGKVLAILEDPAARPRGQGKPWIEESPGEVWFAAGLTFTSFGFVETSALLVAELGHRLVFALLGVSRLRLPKDGTDKTTYAYVELEIEAVLAPDEGVFGLTAVIGPSSYVIAPACHLTGGFAFFVWFGKNPNAGQFVITLGGYHPAFVPPDGYPSEPRLGFNWAVTSEVTVKGGAYFALTPSCVMAGGSLEATFRAGALEAWFTAQADMLVAWHPFSFSVHIAVSIGISYRLDLGAVTKTLSVSVGASVDLWGPPTSGEVTVHLWFVSFTVHIGAAAASAADERLEWPGVRHLLPEAICTATPVSGLNRTLDAPAGHQGKAWVVRATGFAFRTESAIPATKLQIGSRQISGLASAVDVRPMNVTGATSTHSATLKRAGDGTVVDLGGWSPEAQKRRLPESIWGTPQVDTKGHFTQRPQKASAATVEGTVGALLSIPAPDYESPTGLVPLSELAYEPVRPPEHPTVDGFAPLVIAPLATTDFVPTFSDTTVGTIVKIADAPAKDARTALAVALTDAKLYAGPDGELTQLGRNADASYADPPLVLA
jgi:hypothetical protein